MKKILLIIALIFFEITIFGKVLPEEYYKLKSQLWIEDDPTAYAAIRFSREEDLRIIKSLFEILKEYKPDTQEIINERYYIESAFRALMPVTEYKDYDEAFFDDFKLCDKERQRYLLVIKKWRKEEAIKYYIDNGNPEQDAIKMIEDLWTIKNKENYEIGKVRINELFEKKIYDIDFICSYFESIDEKEKERYIINFYEKYFNNMDVRQLNNKNIYVFLRYLITYNKKRQNEIINKFFDKINNNNFVLIKVINASDKIKDSLLNIVCDDNVIFEDGLKKKAIVFLKQNKGLLDNRKEKKIWINEGVRKFLIKNKDAIQYKNETYNILIAR
ncbi:MAG: hypothetical protein N2Z20_02850 [Elusimicrobiales bacterium]|nr:hypothetical protein [Elusimicrobiales bacterium]